MPRRVRGADAARLILSRNDITNVRVQGIAGNLTDNYVPSKKILNLSESTINSHSIAAIGVAAHECGHAIQDHVCYGPLVLTRTITPACAVASPACALAPPACDFASPVRAPCLRPGRGRR